MSETETKTKTYKELENEFNQLAYRCGCIAYDIEQRQNELAMFRKAMQEVSVEGARAKEREAKESPKLQEVK